MGHRTSGTEENSRYPSTGFRVVCFGSSFRDPRSRDQPNSQTHISILII